MSDFIWSQANPKSSSYANVSYYLTNFTIALANWEKYQKEEQIMSSKRNKKP
jgi:hypothetical protein